MNLLMTGAASAAVMLGQLDLDIDGFLMGTQFLTLLANAITGVLVAFLNLFLFGTTVV